MSCTNKPQSYFEEAREDIAALVRHGKNTILEIGCGSGATGLILRDSDKAIRLVGVEIEARMAKEARRIFDKVICGNVEEIDVPMDNGLYDYIICADVLEHLRDPWRVLTRLHKSLKRNGFVISSIPNIRNRIILKELIFDGEWRYGQDGILDSTHLRFFTKKSMHRLFEETGYRIVHIKHFRLGPKATILNAATFGLLEEFLAQRYLIKAQQT